MSPILKHMNRLTQIMKAGTPCITDLYPMKARSLVFGDLDFRDDFLGCSPFTVCKKDHIGLFPTSIFIMQLFDYSAHYFNIGTSTKRG